MKITRIIPFLAVTACLSFGSSAINADNDNVTIAANTQQSSEDAAEELGQRASVRYANELFHNANDPTGGNANGTIAIVEFFDFRCGHCIRMFSVLQGLMKKNPNLKIIYKNYPVLGPESELAARAALAANIQGKYMIYQAMLFGSDISSSSVFAMAKEVGLDIPKLKNDMNSEQVERAINATSKLADNMGIGGTPAFIIAKSDLTTHSSPSDVVFYPGEISMGDLQQAIDKITH